jgi:plasmid stability protein
MASEEAMMAQILVRDLTRETVESLKGRAERNRRSLQAELRLILEEVAERERRRASFDEAVAAIDRIRAASGPQTTDSTELIREDRDR